MNLTRKYIVFLLIFTVTFMSGQVMSQVSEVNKNSSDNKATKSSSSNDETGALEWIDFFFDPGHFQNPVLPFQICSFDIVQDA